MYWKQVQDNSDLTILEHSLAGHTNFSRAEVGGVMG